MSKESRVFHIAPCLLPTHRQLDSWFTSDYLSRSCSRLDEQPHSNRDFLTPRKEESDEDSLRGVSKLWEVKCINEYNREKYPLLELQVQDKKE